MKSYLCLPLCFGLVGGCSDPGTSNDCDPALVAGALVITEVAADAAAGASTGGADDGREWFEVYNTTSSEVVLDGLRVEHRKADGTGLKAHAVRGTAIGGRQYLVLGNVADEAAPAWVGYGYADALGDLYNTGGGKLTLACGGVVIDAIDYASNTSGRSRQFDGARSPDATLNDAATNWCDASDAGSEEYDSGNWGTPGDANESCDLVAQTTCDDEGTPRPVRKPLVGDLVITELMPSPGVVADEVGEWFEVQVINDVDLNGLGLDRAGDSSAANVLASPDCLSVAAGDRLVFARADTGNGGLPTPAGLFSFSLVGGSMASPGDIQLLMGTTVIDAVTWQASSNGASLQLDPDFADPAGNDDAAAWCDATATYGGGSDRGTPGAANAECPVVPMPGMCLANGTMRAVVKPSVGTLVISEVMASPAGDDALQEWFEVVNIGSAAFDLNGLSMDRVGDSGNAQVIAATECKTIGPGAFGLLARSATNNDMLPAVDAVYSFALTTSTAVQILDGATVLDQAAWTTATTGAARQVRPNQMTTTGNDSEANWCNATAAYGATTNKGTPKAVNTACP